MKYGCICAVTIYANVNVLTLPTEKLIVKSGHEKHILRMHLRCFEAIFRQINLKQPSWTHQIRNGLGATNYPQGIEKQVNKGYCHVAI